MIPSEEDGDSTSHSSSPTQPIGSAYMQRRISYLQKKVTTSNLSNADLIDAYKNTNEEERRQMMIQKSVKWDKFRLERKVVIEKYCQMKRKQARILAVFKQLFKNRIIHQMAQTCKKAV